jgi:hypothetical protein
LTYTRKKRTMCQGQLSEWGQQFEIEMYSEDGYRGLRALVCPENGNRTFRIKFYFEN